MEMREYSEAEKRTVLIACSVACFITPLLSTMMNLSLINIGEEFDVGSHDLAYVNTSFLLASVIFMAPLSKRGDILGKKRMFLIGLAIIVATCILACFSPTFWFLILCRVVMAAGSAAITTVGMSMVVDIYPPNNRGAALGIQTMCVYTGLALGPTIGGILNDVVGWHYVFLVVIPFCVVSAIMIMRFKGEIAPNAGASLDRIGVALYGSSMLMLMGGAINLHQFWAIPAIAAGAVLMVLFIRRQMSVDNKLIHVDLFRNRVFSGSCLAAFLCYASSYSISFFLALYLQSIGALSSTEAGTLMLVQPAVQAVTTPIFGKTSDKVSDKRLLPSIGIVMVGIGLLSMSTYGLEANFPQIVVTMALIGLGFGVFSSPNTSVVMGSAPREESGEASAIMSVTRQSGMMVSMGIAMATITVMMGSADHIVPDRYPEFVEVFRFSFLLCFGMSMVALAASLLRNGRKTA